MTPGHVSAVSKVPDCRSRGGVCSRPCPIFTFVEIDHEIISMAILPTSADSRFVVSYKRMYVHKVLVNCLVKLA